MLQRSLRDWGMVTPFRRREVDFKTSASFPWCQPKPHQHPLSPGVSLLNLGIAGPRHSDRFRGRLDKAHPVTGMTVSVTQSGSTLLADGSLNRWHAPLGTCFKSIRKRASDFMQISVWGLKQFLICRP